MIPPHGIDADFHNWRMKETKVPDLRFFQLDDLLPLVSTTMGTDMMRQFWLKTLRAYRHRGAFPRVMGPARVSLRFRSSSFWNRHSFILSI